MIVWFLKPVIPGSVADTMAPKNRQSVKKKSPPSWPIFFISITQPYINNLKYKHFRTQVLVSETAASWSTEQKTVSWPNDETGHHSSHKSIGENGAQVPEEMPLKHRRRDGRFKTFDLCLIMKNWLKTSFCSAFPPISHLLPALNCIQHEIWWEAGEY